MRRLTWAPEALDDLHAVELWYRDRDPAAGVTILRRIGEATTRLQDYPRIGRAITEPFRVLGVRTTPYVVIYRLAVENIDIIRVRHGRENWLPVEGEI